MPKVSIIVPFYNVEGYIEKCLETLVNQTLKDIEIIIVNDGSKDRSVNIVEKFIQMYPKKIIYIEKENGGLSDARNYAIPYAKGDYIAFLDSDDYVEKDMYQKMYDLAKKENSDMVQCNFYWEYPNKKMLGKVIEYNNKKDMLKNARVEAWNKIIKRKILEKSNIKFPKGYQYEDVEFTYKLIPFVDKVSFLKEPLVHYVQRENSISNSQNKKVMDIFEVLDHVISYYKENELYDKYRQELEYVYVRYAFCSSLKRIMKISNEELKENLLNETWNKVHEQFPQWKSNTILRKSKNLKNLYLRTINKTTYNFYTLILSLIL